MAIPKVCGIETEYGIQVVHGDPNPIAASSVLINAYAHDVARQQTGWDFEDEAPGNDARGFAREGADATPGRDPSGQHRADQRGPLLRRPRPPRVLHARVPRRPRVPPLRPGRRAHPDPGHGGGRPGRPRRLPGGHLQEQLGREGQLLRGPRELPDGPGRPLHPHRGRHHPPLRDPPDLRRGRQGRGGDRHPRRPARRLPDLPAGGVLRGAGRPGDHPQAPHRQHPGRAPRRSAALPAAPRHRGRRQPGRGGHLLEGGHHRRWCWP